MKTGRLIHSTFFLIRGKKAETVSRFAFSVPKKVANTAVLRNKLRRRGYSAMRAVLSGFAPKSPFHFVFIAKPELKKAKLPEIQADIENFFRNSRI